jgi:hypothetical protein
MKSLHPTKNWCCTEALAYFWCRPHECSPRSQPAIGIELRREPGRSSSRATLGVLASTATPPLHIISIVAKQNPCIVPIKKTSLLSNEPAKGRSHTAHKTLTTARHPGTSLEIHSHLAATMQHQIYTSRVAACNGSHETWLSLTRHLPAR